MADPVKFVTVVKLAERLGIDRSNLLKRIRKAGVATIDVPVMTARGVHQSKAVPAEYADQLIKLFAEAEANAGAETVARPAHTAREG